MGPACVTSAAASIEVDSLYQRLPINAIMRVLSARFLQERNICHRHSMLVVTADLAEMPELLKRVAAASAPAKTPPPPS
jgi:hypothetical protein